MATSKHEAFDWGGVATMLGVAGLNVFQVIQGIGSVVLLIMSAMYGYWRIRATRAKALAREQGQMGNKDRRGLFSWRKPK